MRLVWILKGALIGLCSALVLGTGQLAGGLAAHVRMWSAPFENYARMLHSRRWSYAMHCWMNRKPSGRRRLAQSIIEGAHFEDTRERHLYRSRNATLVDGETDLFWTMAKSYEGFVKSLRIMGFRERMTLSHLLVPGFRCTYFGRAKGVHIMINVFYTNVHDCPL